MAEIPEDLPRTHIFARIQNPKDPLLKDFIKACDENEADVVVHLAPGRDAGALTIGLNKAVGAGHLNLAQKLLQAGAEWDVRTIQLASKSLGGVKLLVESGFDVNTGLIGGTVLLSDNTKTIFCNNEDGIRYLLEHGANPKLGAPLYTKGALHKVRPVLNSPWNLNSAARFCSPETFSLLLSYGADMSNAIPLHYAAGRGPSPENTTSSGSRISMLEYLVGLGLDVNSTDDAIKISERGNGQLGTPIQYAIWWGRVDETKWLLERGADPDIKTVYGVSARDRAKRRLPAGHEILALLGEI